MKQLFRMSFVSVAGEFGGVTQIDVPSLDTAKKFVKAFPMCGEVISYHEFTTEGDGKQGRTVDTDYGFSWNGEEWEVSEKVHIREFEFNS